MQSSSATILVIVALAPFLGIFLRGRKVCIINESLAAKREFESYQVLLPIFLEPRSHSCHQRSASRFAGIEQGHVDQWEASC